MMNLMVMMMMMMKMNMAWFPNPSTADYSNEQEPEKSSLGPGMILHPKLEAIFQIKGKINFSRTT